MSFKKRKFLAFLMVAALVFSGNAGMTAKAVSSNDVGRAAGGVSARRDSQAKDAILEESDGEYRYIVQSDGAELTKYVGSSKEITIPANIEGNQVTSIGEGCFEDADIESVVLPKGIKEVKDYAFNECVKLKTVSFSGIPYESEIDYENETYDEPEADENFEDEEGSDTLEKIGKAAFFSCKRLEKVDLPPSVKKIGDGAFYDCEKLEDVCVNSDECDFGEFAFGMCTSLKNIYISDGNKKISDLMFWNCESLERVEFGEGISEIGRKAFQHCGGLKEVTLADSITEIKEKAFAGTALRTVTMNCETIGDSAFEDCNLLTSVDLGDNLVSIGEKAFCRAKIGVVNIPETTKKIGDEAFALCKTRKFYVDEENKYFESKNGVLYDEDMTELINYPNNKKAESFTVPDSVKKIDAYGFADNEKLKNIVIGSGVTEIGKECFYNAKGLEDVVIPENVTKLGEEVFGTSSVKTVTVPGSVEDIPKGAFASCDMLSRLTLSEGVKTMEKDALYGTENLDEINLPASMEKIHGGAFGGLMEPKKVSIASENEHLKMDGNGIFSKDGKELFLYQGTRDEKTYKIKDGVEKIADYAFRSSDNLDEITLPSSIKEIGKKAFGYVENYGGESKKTGFVIYGDGMEAGVNYAAENNFAYLKGKPKINAEKISIKSGDTFDLSVENTVPGGIYFASANSDIAKADYNSGKITGVGKGVTTVYAVMGTMFIGCEVEVTDGAEVAHDKWGAYREIEPEELYDFEERYYGYNSNLSLDKLDNPAIYCYSGSEYIPIVAAQDPNHRHAERAKETYGDDIKQYSVIGDNLSRELSRFVLPESIKLFSGQYDVSAFTGKGSTLGDMIAAVGKTVTTKTVISTSVQHSVATSFSGGLDGTVLEIYAPSGNTRGAYIAALSRFPTEYELLLDKGVTFEVVGAGIRTMSTVSEESDADNLTYVDVPERYLQLKIVGEPIDVGKPSATPAATTEPNETATPAATTEPNETATPAATTEPNETAAPAATTKPNKLASPLKKGAKVTVKKSNSVVKITNAGKVKGGKVTGAAAVFVKAVSKKAKGIVPASVNVNGVSVKVTAVADGAFSGDKKLKEITIGENVKKIGKNAFKNCSKLKKINIKSKVLTTVGKNAIKGINNKAKIKAPGGKKKTYAKLFAKV